MLLCRDRIGWLERWACGKIEMTTFKFDIFASLLKSITQLPLYLWGVSEVYKVQSRESLDENNPRHFSSVVFLHFPVTLDSVWSISRGGFSDPVQISWVCAHCLTGNCGTRTNAAINRAWCSESV